MAFYSETLALPNNAFLILRDLIVEKTGIYFEESKKDILADKLSNRVLECGLNSFLDYYYLLKYDASAKEEWNAVFDLITVKETYFWREYDHIEAMLTNILPEFYKRNHSETFRIWCAACATGEEPLTILMALDASGWLKKLRFEIYASDASRQALETAREGLFRERSLRNLSEELREQYFTRENNLWRIDPRLQSMVKWKLINLKDEVERTSVPVQNIIFCRNVFIYFEEDTIKKVAESFFFQLHSPGFLFVGVSESLFRITTHFELIELGKTFVYKKPELSDL